MYKSSPIIISPTNGLCNKLRVVFSYLQIARASKKKLIVLWNDTEDKARDIGGTCPGFFLNYFEALRDVEFIETNEGYKDLDITYKGCWPHKAYDPNESFIYNELRLLPFLEAK